MLRNAVLAFVLAAVFSGFVGSAHAAAPDPALSQKWVVYGQQVFTTRNYDLAIKAFSTAARADSRNAAAWKGLANCFYYKRDYPNALKYYKFAYQLNPADTGLAAFIPKLEAATSQSAQAGPTDLAARYYNAKRYDEAIQSYNQALASNPNDAKAWQGLGNCYYAKQDKPKAVEAYKRALQLNPQNTGLSNFLARYSPESATAAGVNVEYGERDWVQPLWRSAVLPGWGQFYNDEPTKGTVLMIADLALLGGTVGTYIVGNGARTTYESLGAGASQSAFDSSYNTWDEMANLNHIFNIAWGVVYAFTLVDAVVSAKRHPITKAMFEEKPPALQLGMVPHTDALGIKYRLLEF
jgi:tetratricopeptide (TPR) repeat protein